MRPSRDELFMQMAETAAQRGTCDRAYVGAIIVQEGRPISMGYNGAPPGFAHCTEVGHGSLTLYKHIPDQGGGYSEELVESGCTRAVHAEANAIAWAARNGVATFGGEMYCTYSPCKTCAELLLASGIGRFIYRNDYRAARLDLLTSIEVVQL